MLIVEVDCVDAQSLERSFTRLADVLAATIDAALGRMFRIEHVAELGGDDNAIALSLDRFADQLFVLEWPVHIGSVEHVDAELERAMDGRDGFLLVARPVKLRHAHAAKADGKCLETLRAESACFRGGGTHCMIPESRTLGGKCHRNRYAETPRMQATIVIAVRRRRYHS